jgi:hypothetical protein
MDDTEGRLVSPRSTARPSVAWTNCFSSFLLIFFLFYLFFPGCAQLIDVYIYRRFTLGLLCGPDRPDLVYHPPNLFFKFLLLEDLPVLVIFFALSMKCELSTFDIKDKKEEVSA